MDEADLRRLNDAGTETAARAGQVLIERGQTGSGLYVILDGTVEVRRGDEVVARLSAGDVIGEVAILNRKLRSDGRYRNKLFVDGGPSTTKSVGHLRMEGREVFKHAVTNMHEVIGEILHAAGAKVADIDWFVPHQANKRILDTTAGKLGVPADKFIVTVDKHGNTSAASIPLAFDFGVKQGLIKRGQLVLMEAMGGGFTWGGVLARY